MGIRVSLRQVAAAAEVSISTASLALAGHARVQPDTAARVRAAATELGYVRDQTQSANASNHFRHGGKPALVAAWVSMPVHITRLRHHAATMGMSICALPQQPLSQPAAQPADQPTTRRTARKQATALAASTAPTTFALPTAATLADLGATALIVQCRGLDPRPLADLGVPVVLWDDEGNRPHPCDVIETCEWWTASTQAIERVRHAGYHRPVAVLINADPPHWHDDVRAAAFHAHGIPTLTWDRNDAALRAFMSHHRPDAVIGIHVHVLHALDRLKFTIPFAALLTYDLPWHRHCAGWREDYDRQARTTLELIEQRLRYGERPPLRIVVPPLWHPGKSLPLM